VIGLRTADVAPRGLDLNGLLIMARISDATAAEIRLPRAGARRRAPASVPVWQCPRRPGGTVVALVALYACWGSSFPAMKLMVKSAPPLASAGAVFLLGGLVLGACSTKRRWPLAAQARQAALVGIVLLVGGQGLATVVLTKLTTSLVAVLAATIPYGSSSWLVWAALQSRVVRVSDCSLVSWVSRSSLRPHLARRSAVRRGRSWAAAPRRCRGPSAVC
jgi:hypothetical protein